MTSSFMDKLRQMYDNAAKVKAAKQAGVDTGVETDSTGDLGGYHLCEPEDVNVASKRLPQPVAVPTGEMGDVMKEVITQQKDQPWLVSPEARAPTLIDTEDSMTPEQERRQKQISKKLKEDLQRKREMASSWAEHNLSTNVSKRGQKQTRGFTPQKFHSMMTLRQRYVLVIVASCRYSSSPLAKVTSIQNGE